MILAVLQARMSSKRLPGKVMALLAGQPMVWRQIERLRRARTVDRIIVATSNEQSDDALAGYLVARGQSVFRGAPTDLLDRFARCAESVGQPSHVVRLKGDCPFIDPQVIDAAVKLAISSGADYVANRLPATFPAGLEVEVITGPALIAAAAQERDPKARVSPTAFLRLDRKTFSHATLRAPRDLSHLNWRIKTPADLAFARSVYDALHIADPEFGFEDVLDMIGGRQDLAKYAGAASRAA
jgi:spore coat polysaccharide biosynthesis protein SpsF